MAINIAAIRDLLLPGLMDVTGQYRQIERQWSGVFKTAQSNMQLERTTQMRYLPMAQLKTEGGPTAFDNNAGERFVYNMEPVEVGLGYAITRKAIDDNLYQSQFMPTNLGLNKSFSEYWEVEAAGIFNNATVYNANLAGDGVSLLNVAHPFDYGTWANTTATQMNLNEASLTIGMKSVRKNFVDEAGLKVRARAKQLLVPVDLEDVAIRLLKTELRPGTGNNDVNSILTQSGGIPNGYKVMDYFTSSFSWFLKTDIDGLIHLQRIAYETDMFCDFITDNLLVKGYERAGFFFNDPRCIWGQTPLS
jgi:Mu-like prophage major head subunit gpT